VVPDAAGTPCGPGSRATPPDSSQDDKAPSAANLAGSPEPQASEEPPDPITKQRIEQIEQLNPMVAEEEPLMLDVVQLLDRPAAAEWLGRFLSSPPLNCPVREQGPWIEAIVASVERNGLPLCKEITALVACIICIESGFHVDPPAVDRSRGEDMAAILDRAEKELRDKFGSVLSLPPVPKLYEKYRAKFYPKLLACRTEGDVDMVARSVAKDLRNEASTLPEFIRKIVFKEIDKVQNVVRTKGSMQLNFPKARQLMRDRGERFTDEDLCDYMYTMNGGVDVGVAALKPMFIQYAARYGTRGNLSWLFFVGMDYHYGPFSSRNMMEQIRIRDLSGKKISLDGDFIRYDDKARPVERVSETMQAAMTICPDKTASWIFRAFSLEKDPHYIYTDLHKALAEEHEKRFGKTPFAVVGDLWLKDNAVVKHGVAWKTRTYLRKLDRFLNSIPWD